MTVMLDAEWATDTETPRLVFSGPCWKEMDLQVCIHGEKLRWTCDHCDEMAKRARKGKK